MENIKIRLEGTPKKIDEAVSRLEQLFSVSKLTRPYFDSQRSPDVKLCYLTVYMYGDCRNLYDQVQSLKQELLEWQEEAGRLDFENHKLKEQLGQIPKPRPGDMVLGGTQHRQNRNSEPGF